MYHRDFADVPIIYKPNDDNGKVMKKFKKIVEDKYHVKLDDYMDLHKWSIEHFCEFWAEMWDFLKIVSSKRFDKVLDLNAPMSDLPQWFEGSKLNFAENLLRYRNDEVAIIQDGEDSEIEKYTFAQMYEEAKLYSAAFRKFGLKKGDRVACYMSNRKEAIFAMLGVTSIGAIWTGALPLLGSDAVTSRFKQVNLKVLLTVDRFLQDGEEIDMLSKVKEIVKGLPSLEKVIIIASKPNSYSKDISVIRNSCFLNEFLRLGYEKDGTVSEIQFEQVSFSHPVSISYTSGTTGLPKAIIHGCGMLMAVANAYHINFDGDRGTNWFSASPVGWASWTINSTLFFLGHSLVLFEGSPYYMSPTQMWDLIQKHKISNIFFPSSVIDEFQKRGYVPTEKHDISSLKLVLAGGSVVKPASYDFIKKILKEITFTSSYGCTEVMGIILAAEMSLPMYKSEINVPCLGTAVEIVDTDGNPVIGEIGEIVLRRSIPGLFTGMWNDKDGSIYREKYFSKYQGVFALSDFGILNPVTKNWIIVCRSDETLKQRGCRFGSSEIYNIVEEFPEIRDSLCVSQYNKDLDERAVLFLKIRDGYKYNEELVAKIRKAIEKALTVRHVPDVIIEIKDIPYNLNGKKLEIVVKRIINKLPYNKDSAADQECLQYYFNIPELQGF